MAARVYLSCSRNNPVSSLLGMCNENNFSLYPTTELCVFCTWKVGRRLWLTLPGGARCCRSLPAWPLWLPQEYILDPRPSPLWMYSYAQYLALSTYNNANEAAEKPYSCPVEPGLLQMTATSEKQQRQTDRLSHKHYLSLTSWLRAQSNLF